MLRLLCFAGGCTANPSSTNSDDSIRNLGEFLKGSFGESLELRREDFSIVREAGRTSRVEPTHKTICASFWISLSDF